MLATASVHPHADGIDNEGLTVRDHAAIECMKGILANPSSHQSTPAEVAKRAVAAADALIAATQA